MDGAEVYSVILDYGTDSEVLGVFTERWRADLLARGCGGVVRESVLAVGDGRETGGVPCAPTSTQ